MCTIRSSDLIPYLAHASGNRFFKFRIDGDWAILKVYSGTRSPLQTWYRSSANWLSEQTSYFPERRCQVERESMQIWSRAGFDVFEILNDVQIEAPDFRHERALVTRFVEAPTLAQVLSDVSRPIEERLRIYREFLREWGRRHALAIDEREPRLVHENGDGSHVFVTDHGFLWFDFEMTYRNRSRVKGFVAREIVSYLKRFLKDLPDDIRPLILNETVEGYPNHHLLGATTDYFYSHPNLVHRWARSLDRLRKSKDRHNKYQIATALRRAVLAAEQESLTPLLNLAQSLFRTRSVVGGLSVPVAGLCVLVTHGEPASPTLAAMGITLGLLALAGRVAVAGFTRSGCSSGFTRCFRSRELTVRGYYSVARHPLYVFNTALVGAALMVSGIWWLPVLGALATLLFYRTIARAEDSFLADHFGGEFARWARATPGFLPRLSNWQPWATRFSPARALRREYSTVFAFALAATLLAGLRAITLDLPPAPWLVALLGQVAGFLFVRRCVKRFARSLPPSLHPEEDMAAE